MKLIINQLKNVADVPNHVIKESMVNLHDDVTKLTKSAMQIPNVNVQFRQKIELNDDDAVGYYMTGSAYMFYQLIQTSPSAKKSFLKSYQQNKEHIIKDLDDAEKFESFTNILERTPAYAQEETEAITYITSLAINEASSDSNTYINMIYKALPPLRNLVVRYNNQMARYKTYVETMSRMRDMSKTELLAFTPSTKEEKKIFHVLADHINAHNDQLTYSDDYVRDTFGIDLKAFTIKDIRGDAKRLSNDHDKKIKRYIEDTGQTMTYTAQEMYMIGTLHFASFYLKQLPHAEYEFSDTDEAVTYAYHLTRVFRIYASEKGIDKVKPTKTKDRPLPIRNNEGLGEFINATFTEEQTNIWYEFIGQFYTLIDKRSDLILNAKLSRTDIDTVTRLIKEWDDIAIDNGDKDYLNEHIDFFFILGLFMATYERLQSRNDKENDDTIIRLDEEKRKHFEQSLEQKDKTIANLTARIENLNKRISQHNALKLKYAELEEKLKWQEEITLETEDDDAIDANDHESINIDKVIKRLNNNDVCFLGGNIKWQQNLENDIPNATFHIAEEIGRSMHQLESAQIIVYNTATMNHRMFYKFKNALKRNTQNPIIIYINNQGSNKDITFEKIGRHIQKRRSDIL